MKCTAHIWWAGDHPWLEGCIASVGWRALCIRWPVTHIRIVMHLLKTNLRYSCHGSRVWQLRLTYMLMHVHLQEQPCLVSRHEVKFCTVLMATEASSAINNHSCKHCGSEVTRKSLYHKVLVLPYIYYTECWHQLRFPVGWCIFCKCLYKRALNLAFSNTLQEQCCQLVAHESTEPNSIHLSNQNWHQCLWQEILPSLQISELLHDLVLPECNPNIHTLL